MGLHVQLDPNSALRSLLESHPRVESVREQHGEGALRWTQEDRFRRIYVDRRDVVLRGVVELIDNNPLVCANEFSLPSPAATLAVLALGPLAAAGLIFERPTMLTNIDCMEEEIASFLEPLGWSDGVTLASEPADLGGAVAATVMCAVSTPERLEDLDELFDERYGRSVFVRREEDTDWHVSLVLGKPIAAYRLRISPDQPHSLLTIQIMADAGGKCGAAQIVHAFNVMCGFEESLGI